MRKEVILSVIIGLLLGLVITFTVYKAKNMPEEISQAPEIEKPTVIPEAALNPLNLTIHSPLDESVQTERETKINGTTLAYSFVVIFINETPIISKADESGNFSESVKLNDGANIINVYALDEDGQSSNARRTVIVEDEPFESTTVEEISSDTEESSDTADSDSSTLSSDNT